MLCHMTGADSLHNRTKILHAENMSGQSSATTEAYVDRDAILAFFNPKPGRSTFFDWVNQGLVVRGPAKGYYKLNESLRRLRLPAVDAAQYLEEHRTQSKAEQLRQRHFLALTLVIPEALHVFTTEDIPNTLTDAEIDEVKGLVNSNEGELNANSITDATERLAFVGGALKALDVLSD